MLNRGSVIIIPLIVFLILAIGGGVYIYAEIDSPAFDRFFSETKQKEREITRLRKNFPDLIGSYALYERNPDKIRVASECGRVEGHPDTRSSGITGEVCSKTIIGQYRDTSSDKVVFIHLNILIKGGDIFNALYEKLSKPDVINDYKVFRIENHEIGWNPLQDFDTVLTQEGRWKTGADGSENFSYRETATGNNSVTQHFLTKFPPGVSSLDRTNESSTQQQTRSDNESGNNNLDTNQANSDIFSDLIIRDYDNCLKSTQSGINGQKLCAVIKHLQENGRSTYYWVGRDATVQKASGGGAVAQVDIDINFFGTAENYNQFVENPNRGGLLSKSSAGGTLVQMNSRKVAIDTFGKISSNSSGYEKITVNGISVLKSIRNCKLNFVFFDDEIIYELENVNPSFESPALGIIRVILD